MKKNLDKNNKWIQEQIKNYIIEISSIIKLIRAFPLKVKIEPTNKDLQLNDIIQNKTELCVKIINLSKIPFKIKFTCVKDKESLIEFNDINFELKEKEHIIPNFFIEEGTEVNHSIFYLVKHKKRRKSWSSYYRRIHNSIWKCVIWSKREKNEIALLGDDIVYDRKEDK